jgi:hypothetical protein
LCLTSEAATDPTEASASFTDVRTQDYSRSALDLYGLAAIAGKLPLILPPAQVAGRVTPTAAGEHVGQAQLHGHVQQLGRQIAVRQPEQPPGLGRQRRPHA